MEPGDYFVIVFTVVAIVIWAFTRPRSRDLVVKEDVQHDRSWQRRTDPVWKDRGTL
jgi:hypothetical protein